MSKIVIFLCIGYVYCLSMSKTVEEFVPVDPNDQELKDVIVFAFGVNQKDKEIELDEAQRKVDGEITIYKLKVKIYYYTECTDNESNPWVVVTEKGCRTTSSCKCEVKKVKDIANPFRMESLQCIA